MRVFAPAPHYLTMRVLLLLLIAFASLMSAKSDAEIEADIRARLSRSKIAANGFQVKVHNGVATWTGTAAIVQHKGAATRMAKAAGAVRVNNRIQISAAAKAKASQALRRAGDKSESRTQPRTEARSEEPRADTDTEPDTLAPPPVRRAVVKR